MSNNIGTELNDSELEQATGGFQLAPLFVACKEMGGRFENGKCIKKAK